MPLFIGTLSTKAEVPVPSTMKSNACKNNMSDALGRRRHEYQLAVEFISELLTENTMHKDVCGGDWL